MQAFRRKETQQDNLLGGYGTQTYHTDEIHTVVFDRLVQCAIRL